MPPGPGQGAGAHILLAAAVLPPGEGGPGQAAAGAGRLLHRSLGLLQLVRAAHWGVLHYLTHGDGSFLNIEVTRDHTSLFRVQTAD